MSKARRNRAIDTPQGPPKQGGTASPGKPSKKGGILAALRRSPMVGADLNLVRDSEEPRQVVAQN
jgi:hypothetical protein